MTLKKWIVLFIVAFNHFSLQSQDIQKLLTDLNEYHYSRPIEKIFLHLDKTNYTAGETIWLKAYTTVGVENLLSNLSNIAYIDLIDPKDRVIAAIKIPLISGLSLGDISLQDTLTEGTYRLRAYTNWMRNDSSTYFFSQNIQITNGRVDNVLTSSDLLGENYVIKLKDIQGAPLGSTIVRYEITKDGEILKKGREKTDTEGKVEIPFNSKYAEAKLSLLFENKAKAQIEKIFNLPVPETSKNSIQFFPEGGILLSGSLNKIAAKAIQPSGLGLVAKTHILNSKGDTAATIETNHLGMGSSAIFLDAEETYEAHTTFDDQTTTQTPLPKIETSGYNIQVNNNNASKLFAQVNLSADKQDNADIYFMVQYMGQTYYTSRQKASESQLVFSVNKANLPSGVLTISILNENLFPISERAVFLHPKQDILPLGVTLSAPTIGLRKRVTVSLESGIPSDSLRNAVLSATATNNTRFQKNASEPSDILSSLLLNADLKGFIETPSYYFAQEEIKANDIDNLLLTQGWRKIDLTATLSTAKPDFTPEKSISIRGQAHKLGRKAPSANAKMTLISTQNFMDYIDTVANEEGLFAFDNLLFPDSVKFLVTAKDDKGKNNIDIRILSPSPPQVDMNKNRAAELNNLNSLYLEELLASKKFFAGLESQGLMERSIAIEEVVVTANARTNKASEHTSNLNGRGNADQVIGADELSTCATLEQCLNGRLMGVYFELGKPYNTRGRGEMQVVLDGMYIQSDQIEMINPSQIESVEVLRNANYTSIYGSYGGNGLIVVTSKTGADIQLNYTPRGILTIQPQGLHLNKTFYKPEYDVDSKKQLSEDFRNTIHWEPNIVTDAQGKASFDFYTSDEPGTYLITIQGLDFNGRLVNKTVPLEVR